MNKIKNILMIILICLVSIPAQAGTCDPSLTNTLPQTSGSGGNWPPDAPGQVSPGYITHMEGIGGPGINFTYTPNVGSPVNFTISFGASSGVVCTSQQAGGWGGYPAARLKKITFQGSGTPDTLFLANGNTTPSDLIWCTGLKLDSATTSVWSGVDAISKVYTGPGTRDLWFAGYDTAGGFNKTSNFIVSGNCKIKSRTWIYADSANLPRVAVDAPGASSAELFVNGVSQGIDSTPPFDLSAPTSLVPGDEPNVTATVNWTSPPGSIAETTHASIFAPTRIATGNGFACATTGFITSSGFRQGFAQCWGLNNYGQVGTNSATYSFDTPQDVKLPGFGSLASVSYISAGHENACVVRQGGIFCWGRNSYGILGVAPATLPLSKEAVQIFATGSGFKKVLVGRRHACALKTSGDLYCWGHGGYGQTGNGSGAVNTVTTPVLAATGVITFSVNRDTTFWQKSGNVWAVGYDAHGEVGNGLPLATQTTPVQIITGGATSLWSGLYHTCAKVFTTPTCWGANYTGEVGLGYASPNVPTPTIATAWNGINLKEMVAGDGTTCGITTTNGIKCLGYNATGQLGIGSVIDQLTPVTPSGYSSNAYGFTASYYNICGFVNGHVSCAGDNTYDQIGDPAAGNPQLTPYTVFGY